MQFGVPATRHFGKEKRSGLAHKMLHFSHEFRFLADSYAMGLYEFSVGYVNYLEKPAGNGTKSELQHVMNKRLLSLFIRAGFIHIF